MSSADKQQRMDHFFAAHRQAGLPVTTQRRAVFEAIRRRADHPTADQLYRAVRGALQHFTQRKEQIT
jgi:Fe2+ or Zn2+ uptake regulation protein